FGGGGFIGRYVCEALLKAGARLRVAERNPRRAWFLQPLGSVGQVSAIAADLGRPAGIERAVDGSDAVINLVGIFKGDLDRIHVDGARLAAKTATAAGAKAFVQVSAIGADPGAASDYARTKGLGEQAVSAAFPHATIIRPSVVFGAEDQFTNRFAGMARLPFLPVIAPKTRFQPVYVRDLAEAIAAAALDPARYGGKTYELAGPDAITMRELNAEIAALADQSPELVDVPDFIAAAMAALGFLPGAPLSRDQWLMLQQDNVPSGDFPGFKAFGIEPAPLSSAAPEWLGRFRKGGRFAPRLTEFSA
ncbi:MAG: complex I NDUFA9 subunit family protein, partial [Sphingomicrobium sp.]